jgi:hypothetical protein
MYKVTPIDDGKEMNIEVNGTFEEVVVDFLKATIGTIELLSEQTKLDKKNLCTLVIEELSAYYNQKDEEETTEIKKDKEEE